MTRFKRVLRRRVGQQAFVQFQELSAGFGHRAGQPDQLLFLLGLSHLRVGGSQVPQAFLDVITVHAIVFANRLTEYPLLGCKATLLRFPQSLFESGLQLGRLNPSLARFLAGRLCNGDLQPPEPILHRPGGANRGDVLRQHTRLGLIDLVDEVGGDAASHQPEHADQDCRGHDPFPHPTVPPKVFRTAAGFDRLPHAGRANTIIRLRCV